MHFYRKPKASYHTPEINLSISRKLSKLTQESKEYALHKNLNDPTPPVEHKTGNTVQRKNNKKDGQFQILLLLLILLFSGVSMWLVKANAIQSKDVQLGIAEDIIRFHVIANSDSDKDQALKMVVKDTLVKNLSPYLASAASIDDARIILESKLSYIQEVAENTIEQNGYSYPVTVSLEDSYFPLKRYGAYTFPPGTYEALRVKIGEAQGKNWWCVMFPPLCFVDETYGIVDEASGEQLKHLLSDEEYESLINQKTPIKIKFKLWNNLKNLFS
jgi:stage II sporulation protein R